MIDGVGRKVERVGIGDQMDKLSPLHLCLYSSRLKFPLVSHQRRIRGI